MEGGSGQSGSDRRSPRRRLTPTTPTAQPAHIDAPKAHRSLNVVQWKAPTIGGRTCDEHEYNEFQLWSKLKGRSSILSPKTSSAADWKELYNGKQTEWEMKSLTPGESYVFRVSVTLSDGSFIHSEPNTIRARQSQPQITTPTAASGKLADLHPESRTGGTTTGLGLHSAPPEKDPAPPRPAPLFPARGAETPSGNKRINGFSQMCFVLLLMLYIMTHAWFLQAIVYKIGDSDMEPVLPHIVVDPLPRVCGECETGDGFTWPITGRFDIPAYSSLVETNALSGSQGLWALASSDNIYWYSPAPPTLVILANNTQEFRLPGNCLGQATAPIYLIVGLLKQGQYDLFKEYGRGQKVEGPPFDDRFALMSTTCGVSCGGVLPHVMKDCLLGGAMNWTKLVSSVSLGTALAANRYVGNFVTHTFVLFALVAFVVRVFGFFPGLAFVWPPAPPTIGKMDSKIPYDTDSEDDEDEPKKKKDEKKQPLLKKKKSSSKDAEERESKEKKEEKKSKELPAAAAAPVAAAPSVDVHAMTIPASPSSSGSWSLGPSPVVVSGAYERPGPIYARLASLTCCAPGESAVVILRNLLATFEGLMHLRDKAPSVQLSSILFEDTEKIEEPSEATRIAREKRKQAVLSSNSKLSVRLGFMNGVKLDSHHIARVWRNFRDWLITYPGSRSSLRNKVQLLNHLLREWKEDEPVFPNDDIRDLLTQLVYPSPVQGADAEKGELPWVDDQRRECQQFEFEGVIFKYMFHCAAIGSHPGDTGKGACMQTVVRHIKGFENLREAEKNLPGGRVRVAGSDSGSGAARGRVRINASPDQRRGELQQFEPHIPTKRVYLALLDSRHAPLAQFFTSCMPFFFRAAKRPRFVQGRQFFGMIGTSDDAVDRRGEYFFEYICFLRNFAGVCSSCGTNAIWSMADWAKSGAPFNYESTTLIEDTETSQRVHGEGEITEYLPKPLVHGLAKPPREYLKAQIRWSTGAVELWTHFRTHWQISLVVVFCIAFEFFCIIQGFKYSDVVGLFFPTLILIPLVFLALAKANCVRGLQHRIVMWLNTWYWMTGMATSFFYCVFLPSYVSLYGGLDLNLHAMVGGMLVSQLIDYFMVWIIIRWSPTIHSTYFLRSFQNWIPAWASGIAALMRGLRRASPICPNRKGACCMIGWNADPWVLKVEMAARFGQLLVLVGAIVTPFVYDVPNATDYGNAMAAAGAGILLLCAVPPTFSLVVREGSRKGISSQWLFLSMAIFAFVFLSVSDSKTMLRQSSAYWQFNRD